MPVTDTLVHEAQQFVRSFFQNKISPELVFHNLDHTRDVVRICETMAEHYKLSNGDTQVLLLAAWFHDTGYSAGILHHEDESVRVAEHFLNARSAAPELIEQVKNSILATRMPQSPKNLIEQILCDADLYHLGTSAFADKNKLLRQEINKVLENRISKKDWKKKNIEFLQSHQYFTDYAKQRLDPVKKINLHELETKSGKEDAEPEELRLPKPPSSNGVSELTATPPPPASEDEKKKEKDKKEKQSRTERGIVAMFRIMSENHVNLSQMADSKANIMISVNTIVISIMVSVLLGKLQFYPEYIIPTIILVGVCLAAVIFAILATRPNISGGTFRKEDIENKQVNLLFFGNFYNMGIADYEWAMKEMMNDREYLYGSMTKDIYYLGVVLARKYKFLRISYNIFMYGLIAAIIAFGIAFVVAEQQV
jgi:predicted metal-dependent HD superfamily phosphohydrolase